MSAAAFTARPGPAVFDTSDNGFRHAVYDVVVTARFKDPASALKELAVIALHRL